MKLTLTLTAAMFIVVLTKAQEENHNFFKGMYIQWGYNSENYTHSNIHFKMSNGNNFTLHHAKAHDTNGYEDIIKRPTQISIPQYNYRIGFYLNKSFTKAIEINFDHAKYIVADGQNVHVTGTIDKVHVDGDSILNRETFLHFEHTDGANWLHINYVEQKPLFLTKIKKRDLLTLIYKAGAGINIPRTDFTWRGERLNNDFHIAGYNFAAEGGLRFYPLKKLFLEGTAKTGFVKYVNALVDTNSSKGNRATHDFGYLEEIVTLGYQFKF